MTFQWAKEGDANSRLLHRVAFGRCRKSLIKELELEGGGGGGRTLLVRS